MFETPAYAARSAAQPLEPFTLERREPGSHDVSIDIMYCGVCHSDIHQVRDEWGAGIFPMVPGHEIIGRIGQVGSDVKTFAVGDLAGVGCMVDSCRQCAPCQEGHEQFCERGASMTYNGTLMDRYTPTYGGYSTRVVVDAAFTLKIPSGLDPAGAAPLLCAGVTTYSPLRQWNCKKGDRVGVIGLGGLGHMAVKLAASMGAEVTVLSTSQDKEADALRLGAQAFASTRDDSSFRRLRSHFDLIIDTVSAPHDYNRYLSLLRPFGAMVLLGIPPEPSPLSAGALVMGNRKLAGSLIGGIAETQEVLDYCAEHGVVSDVEIIPIAQINTAYERMIRGDVRYRFVIDISSLK